MSWCETLCPVPLFTPAPSLPRRRALLLLRWLLLLFWCEKFRGSSFSSDAFHPGGSGRLVRSQPFTPLILFLKPSPDNQMGRITPHAVFLSFPRLRLPKTPNNSATPPGKVQISVITVVVRQVFSPWLGFFLSGCFDAFRTHLSEQINV